MVELHPMRGRPPLPLAQPPLRRRLRQTQVPAAAARAADDAADAGGALRVRPDARLR